MGSSEKHMKKPSVALPRPSNPLKFHQAALITPTHRFQNPYLICMPPRRRQTVSPSHSPERFIWRMPRGDFIKFVTNTHLDSRMVWSDFGGKIKGQGHGDLTKQIFCLVKVKSSEYHQGVLSNLAKTFIWTLVFKLSIFVAKFQGQDHRPRKMTLISWIKIHSPSTLHLYSAE